ncbi:MAG: prephenate dehydrogenase/arogenate dehydrogenase family protein [Gemmatimonadota bacterium]|jgi:prephenate dehydrogenase|nr:prephenate dehydrogenase/arogenate dehydrogenase family protein [Gemmatimonadota bacterium]
MKESPRSTAIIGLGLMGGSLARDLAAAGVRISASDRDRNVVEAAINAGIVTESLDESLRGVSTAELIVIATPVDSALEALDAIAEHAAPDAVITDVGSVKRSIEARALKLGMGARFAGSHPLAGDHRSGWGAARDSLYAGAPVFVCPTVETTPEALQVVRTLWGQVGAVVEEIDAADHDHRMAWMSHLPQIVSTALANALSRSDYTAEQLGPGGRDTTRLAASSPDLWAAISSANADYIRDALDDLGAAVNAFRNALDRADTEELRALFDQARRWRS